MPLVLVYIPLELERFCSDEWLSAPAYSPLENGLVRRVLLVGDDHDELVSSPQARSYE